MDAAGPPGQMGGGRLACWRAVVRVLRSPAQLLDDVVTTIFPADCRCCGGPLLRAGTVPVCDACVGRVMGLSQQDARLGCGVCGEAMDLGLDLEDERFEGQMAAALRCRECRLAEPAFARAVSYGTYAGELRALIQLLKFDHLPGLAKLLGELLAEAVLQLEGAAGHELLVVPVPLYCARERQRGYNQSVLLAERAVKRLRTLRPDWRLTIKPKALRRVRSTEAQYVLSKPQRRRNLRGAFEVCDDVGGLEVLVLDDILTSGATARECARVLKAAGASRVWVGTVGRAQRQEMRRRHEDPGDLVASWDAA